MNEANLMHAKRIISELQRILSDLPNPEVTSYRMSRYPILGQLDETIKIEVSDSLTIEVSLNHKNLKGDV